MALVLTKKGLELLQKLQVGEIPAIEFSDVAVGDGLWASSDINLDIAALKSVRIKTGIGSKKTTTRGEDTIVTISATLNNENITESFYVREVGLYAKDGESEILYAYDIIPENETAQAVVQSNIVPQYIPIMLDTALSNIDKVNITVTDDINFVITSEFEEYKEDTAETINNLKSELQGKIDEANELIASLNTAIDTAKSEITTAYKQADTTMQTTITKAYKAADTALQTAINGKAATNHNHDSTYSKTNHTHSNYAASSHNHDSVYMKKASAAPKPINTSGVGQVYYQNFFDSSEYGSNGRVSIPAGGTWVYWHTGVTTCIKGGIVAGGTTFSQTNSHAVVAYRIA